MTEERNGQVQFGEQGSSEPEEGWLHAYVTSYDTSKPLGSRRPEARDFTRMIDIDGMAQALDYCLTLPLRQGLPYVEPHPQDKGEADLIRRRMFAPAHDGGMTTPLVDVLAQMTTAVTHRYAPFEKVMTEEDGEIFYKKLAFRPQTKIRIRRDRNGSFNGYLEEGERSSGEPDDFRFEHYKVRLGPERVFVYFHGGNRRPNVGESALEAPYRSHREKLKVMELGNEALQNHSLGIYIGTHAPRASEQKRKSFWNALKGIRGGGRMLKGPEEKVEQVAGQGAGEDFRNEKSYHDAQMCLAVLVQFILLSLSTGPTGTGIGSNALSRDHSDFFTMSQESRREEMAVALTNHAVAYLVSLNFPDPKFPRIRYLPLSDTERQRALEVWRQLVTSAIQRVEQIEFDAIQERALQAIGVDVRELEDKAGERVDEGPIGPAPPGEIPGSPEFQRSVQELMRTVSPAASSSAGGPATPGGGSSGAEVPSP